MTKIGEFIDYVNEALDKRFPDVPEMILVAEHKVWQELMADITAPQVFQIETDGMSHRGIPVRLAGGPGRDYEFKVVFKSDHG